MTRQRVPVLPERGRLGIDTARDVIAYVTPLVPTVLESVEAWLRTQSSGPISYWFWSAGALSRLDLRPDEDRVTVVSAQAGYGRRLAIARIGMHRDGSVCWRQYRDLTQASRSNSCHSSKALAMMPRIPVDRRR
jgi:hypothetical protein